VTAAVSLDGPVVEVRVLSDQKRAPTATNSASATPSVKERLAFTTPSPPSSSIES
jgi:hypothetical protein